MKDDLTYIKHIRDAVEEIESFVEGVDFNGFKTDDKTQSAVVRQLEIIGEAANSISNEFKEENSEIPWQDITDMRNKLIHEYFKTDVETVWKTIQENVSELKEEIQNILNS